MLSSAAVVLETGDFTQQEKGPQRSLVMPADLNVLVDAQLAEMVRQWRATRPHVGEKPSFTSIVTGLLLRWVEGG
jgi:hypothetical protein